VALQKTNLFDVVEPVYKKHLLDVVDDGQLSVNFTPNDTKFNEQWSYNNTGQGNGTAGKDIKLIDAWDIETGKPNVLVDVHDMGIQLDHPDLAQNIAVGKSFNFIDNNDTIVQGYHGTHTAGTIAAVMTANAVVGFISKYSAKLFKLLKVQFRSCDLCFLKAFKLG
jgi:subtilisin family serine protease